MLYSFPNYVSGTGRHFYLIIVCYALGCGFGHFFGGRGRIFANFVNFVYTMWTGDYLTAIKGLDMSLAGTGFTVFSAAMLIMRLLGDAAVQKLGQKPVVLGGSLLAFLGFLLVIFAPGQLLLYAGFFAIGIGSANVVPVFFSLLGKQKDMPVSMAVPP